MNKINSEYSYDGFAKINYLSSQEYEILKLFSSDWISTLFGTNGLSLNNEHSIEAYHLNLEGNETIHNNALRAMNRHCYPSSEIKKILINSKFREALNNLDILDFDLWDEGLGWLAFRLIRPGFNDGYPFSKKDWGPGKGTVSIWIPILGFDPNQTIGFIPGSHKKEFEKFLPQSSKFTPDEYRLKNDIPESDVYRPHLHPGEAIIFGPKTIHTEDVYEGLTTRLSLEFRILPKL
jgi:hypothetical protein